MVLLSVPVGLLIGLSLGALGGGGSILTVPALVYVLHQDAHGATAASLIVVGVTALVGVAVHARAGRVRIALGLAFGVLGAAGSYVGSRLSARVDPNVLLAAFSVLIAAAAVTMLRRRGRSQPGPSEFPATAPPAAPPGGAIGLQARLRLESVPISRLVGVATAVGLLTGFFGVGGGFVVVPAMVLVLRLGMQEAVGTSLLVIAINSATALLSRAGTHPHLDVPLLVLFTCGALAGTVIGSRLAGHARPARLVTGFGWLLLGVAAYTAGRSIPHLS